MNLRDFRVRVLFRVIFIGLTLALLVFMVSRPNMLFAAVLMGVVLIIQLADLFNFVSQTNRRLTRFLESIKYSDFISGFSTDHKLGKSFKDLNKAFNDVLEAFRKTRSEKEEHWQYLNTIVQQVRTGLISYDNNGNIELINTNAKRFLDVQSIRRIDDLLDKNPQLYKAILDTAPGRSNLYKGRNEMHLTIQATELRIRGNTVKLITLQNIQSEMQRQELEAWQNLTRVLRHEIMNSITPISSLTSTLKDILTHDLTKDHNQYILQEDTTEDLKEGLTTIENRSKSLINFIEAYREYTSIPQAKIRTVRVLEIIEKVAQFVKPDLRQKQIEFIHESPSEYLTIQADPELIEQVLINLVKNSVESLHDTTQPMISLIGSYEVGAVTIKVRDNGPGIIREALNSIFVPFYTTKKNGSGIGLSLSRQIMQMHNGSLTVDSEPDVETVFTLTF